MEVLLRGGEENFQLGAGHGNKQRRRERFLGRRPFEIGFEGWMDWIWHKDARGRGFQEQGT